MRSIITVGRQFGTGGHEIGEKLADKLGIKCLTASTSTMSTHWGPDVIFSWGSDGKLKQVCDKKTGKLLNGTYLIDGLQGSSDGKDTVKKYSSMSFFMSFKNGYPVTGDVTVTVGNKKIIYRMDPDNGYTLENVVTKY